MVVKIVYYIRYQDEEYAHDIEIEAGVDYAYVKALLDALLDRGYNFKLENVKEDKGERA